MAITGRRFNEPKFQLERRTSRKNASSATVSAMWGWEAAYCPLPWAWEPNGTDSAAGSASVTERPKRDENSMHLSLQKTLSNYQVQARVPDREKGGGLVPPKLF